MGWRRRLDRLAHQGTLAVVARLHVRRRGAVRVLQVLCRLPLLLRSPQGLQSGEQERENRGKKARRRKERKLCDKDSWLHLVFDLVEGLALDGLHAAAACLIV